MLTAVARLSRLLAGIAAVIALCAVSNSADAALLKKRTSFPLPRAISDGHWWQIPGALPPGFHYQYNDSWHGWPLEPVHQQHPVRGGFNDPRPGGYHFGIDISADDAVHDSGAPRYGAHRVIAVDGGPVVAQTSSDFYAKACNNAHFVVGHFAYWHIIPTVKLGQVIRAGQQIGWTCPGEWHIHLSEWQIFNGKLVWVNPLHPGGKLTPYSNRKRPQIGRLRFYSAPKRKWCPTTSAQPSDDAKEIPLTHLQGAVELRVSVADPMPDKQFFNMLPPSFSGALSPYKVAVAVWSLTSGKLIFARTSFQSDLLLKTPFFWHFAPGSREKEALGSCVKEIKPCTGHLLFRPFSQGYPTLWDTRHVPDGLYRVTVYAWNDRGLRSSRSASVLVANSNFQEASLIGLAPLVSARSEACSLSPGRKGHRRGSDQ